MLYMFLIKLGFLSTSFTWDLYSAYDNLILSMTCYNLRKNNLCPFTHISHIAVYLNEAFYIMFTCIKTIQLCIFT